MKQPKKSGRPDMSADPLLSPALPDRYMRLLKIFQIKDKAEREGQLRKFLMSVQKGSGRTQSTETSSDAQRLNRKQLEQLVATYLEGILVGLRRASAKSSENAENTPD
ncbi:MAG: hypothetical protein L0Z53_17200 [Acidobacteriales bacterium]|nr:hypothetical protein [Terriglobales bacterium]